MAKRKHIEILTDPQKYKVCKTCDQVNMRINEKCVNCEGVVFIGKFMVVIAAMDASFDYYKEEVNMKKSEIYDVEYDV